MKLWTIHDMRMLRCLDLKLEYRPSLVYSKDFKYVYKWLQNKLGYKNPPVWFWTTRPNVPYVGGYGFEGDVRYLITAEIPEDRIRFIDLAMWSFVLNGHYLAKNEEEWEALENNTPTKEEIELSWDRIFDEKFERDLTWLGEAIPQAVTERLFLSDVLTLEEFKIKSEENG